MKVYIISTKYDAGMGLETAILDTTLSKEMAKQLFHKHIKEYIDYWYNQEFVNDDFVLKSNSQEDKHYTTVEYDGEIYFQEISIITKELV